MKNNIGLRKRLFFYTIILILIIALLGIKNFLPKILSIVGKICYDNKNYVCSTKYYCTATKINRLEYDYSYYCVKSLINLPLTYNVQKEIYDMSLQNQAGAGRILAAEKIENIKQTIENHFHPNYIKNVLLNGKIIRWSNSSFPLKVYFEPLSSTVPKYFEEYIQKAFSFWQNTSKNKFSFVKVDDYNHADIVIKYTTDENVILEECVSDKCFMSVAETTPVYENQKLKQMIINFNILGLDNEPLPPKQLYRTSLHEIGHALGLLGHSENENDLMYMSDHIYTLPSDIITIRDLNTLRLLYILHADISDSNISENATLYSPIILGAQKQLNLGAFEQASSYVKKVPKNVVSWIELAIAHYNLEEYNEAQKALIRALDFARTSTEKFNIYFNLAVVANSMGDYEKALEYIAETRVFSDDVSIDILKARILNNMKKPVAAIETLEKARNYYPYNAELLNMLSTLYIKNYKYVCAITLFKEVMLYKEEILEDEVFEDKKLFINIAKYF